MNGHMFYCACMMGLAAAVDVGSQLVGLVVHLESLRSGHERNWAVRSSYDDDSDDHWYFRLAPFSEDEVVSAEKTKYLVHDCGNGYVCFESVEYQEGRGMPYRNWYLMSAYPSGASPHLVMLEEEYYPQGNKNARWKVDCDSTAMTKCTLWSERTLVDDDWKGRYMCTQWFEDPIDAVDGYYISCCTESDIRYFRIYAPEPSDRAITIYEGTNDGDVTTDPYKKEITIGMEKTTSSTTTISESTSIEVGASFKKFSGGVNQSVSKEWSDTTSTTFKASIKTTYTFTIPPHTHLVVTQLLGSYGNVFDIHSEKYNYHYTDMISGEKLQKTKKARINKNQECEMKDEM